jgi:hypothetical protein
VPHRHVQADVEPLSYRKPHAAKPKSAEPKSVEPADVVVHFHSRTNVRGVPMISTITDAPTEAVQTS